MKYSDISGWPFNGSRGTLPHFADEQRGISLYTMGAEEKRIQGMICITRCTNRAIAFFYVCKLQRPNGLLVCLQMDTILLQHAASWWKSCPKEGLKSVPAAQATGSLDRSTALWVRVDEWTFNRQVGQALLYFHDAWLSCNGALLLLGT